VVGCSIPVLILRGWVDPVHMQFCRKPRKKSPVTPPGIFFFFFFPVLLVSCTLLVWNCSGIRRKTACCGFFHYEKSDGFGRERTRDLGYRRPARKPLDHRSRWDRSRDLQTSSVVPYPLRYPMPTVTFKSYGHVLTSLFR
jgi:hypothetical protein